MIMNLSDEISFNLDEKNAARLVSATYMVQTAQTFDGIYWRIANIDGDIIVMYRNYFDDNVDIVDREFVEKDMALNFNHYPVEAIRVERTLH